MIVKLLMNKKEKGDLRNGAMRHLRGRNGAMRLVIRENENIDCHILSMDSNPIV